MAARFLTTRHIVHAVLVGLLILPTASSALADGKYFRLRTVAGEADPDMPFQRAIIAYRDGVQTMIVESAVQGTGGELAWVIPLPAEPTSITACTPGTLRSVYQLVGPQIELHVSSSLGTSIAVFVVIFLVFLMVVDNQLQGQGMGSRLARILALVICLFVLAAIFLPSLGAPRGAGSVGVEVMQHVQVGSYDVSIIKGETAELLRQWFSENEFSLPESAMPVLTQYAESGWCFAVSRIKSSEKSVLSPHPIRFVFNTPKPIYPMKLTGVGAHELQLDLYVIGDDAATAPHLDRMSSDEYQLSQGFETMMMYRNIPLPFDVTEGQQFAADHIKLRIGHPAITELMWSGCTLTHLRGKLTAEDMTDDFVLDWESSASVHKTLYTPTAAREISWAASVYCGSASLLVITLWLAVRSGAPRRWRSLIRLLPVAAILSSAIGVATYAFVPRTTAGAGDIMAHMDRESSMRAYEELLIDIAVGRILPDFEAFDEWWPRQVAERRPFPTVPPLDIPGRVHARARRH